MASSLLRLYGLRRKVFRRFGECTIITARRTPMNHVDIARCCFPFYCRLNRAKIENLFSSLFKHPCRLHFSRAEALCRRCHRICSSIRCLGGRRREIVPPNRLTDRNYSTHFVRCQFSFRLAGESFFSPQILVCRLFNFRRAIIGLVERRIVANDNRPTVERTEIALAANRRREGSSHRTIKQNEIRERAA